MRKTVKSAIKVMLIAAVMTMFLSSQALAMPSSPSYFDCGYGLVTYSGNVYNSNSPSAAQQGVVVKLITHPYQRPAASGSATTDSNGHWSITVNTLCDEDGYFYWQSSSNGPLLKTVSYIPQSTSYTLNIQSQVISTGLADEYANSPGTHIVWSMTTSYQFSIDAKVSGSISTGFLGVDAALQVGTTSGTATTYTVDTTSKVAITYSLAMAWKIVDQSGNYMVYVQQFTAGSLSAPATSEYLSADQVINAALAAGQDPYTTVGPGTMVTTSYILTSTITLDGQVGVTVFGFTLTVHAGTQSGTSQTVSMSFTNSNPSGNNCYVHYVQGANAHLYLYKTGSSC